MWLSSTALLSSFNVGGLLLLLWMRCQLRHLIIDMNLMSSSIGSLCKSTTGEWVLMGAGKPRHSMCYTYTLFCKIGWGIDEWIGERTVCALHTVHCFWSGELHNGVVWHNDKINGQKWLMTFDRNWVENTNCMGHKSGWLNSWDDEDYFRLKNSSKWQRDSYARLPVSSVAPTLCLFYHPIISPMERACV